MASATVRFWRGAWVVDVSTRIDGKRQRAIKTFGAGPAAKAAAQAYAADNAPQAKSGKYRERQTATFAELWEKFAAHELASPDLRPSTVVDQKALGRLYLVPHLGTRLLGEIDAEAIMDMKGKLTLKRAQEILGHASERTTLAIYTHAMRRTRDDSADKIAELAGLSSLGNIRETTTPRRM
jgi:hypothetical protein